MPMNGQPMLPKWPNDGSSHKFFHAVSEDFSGGAEKQKTRSYRAQELSRSCAQWKMRKRKGCTKCVTGNGERSQRERGNARAVVRVSISQ